MSMDREEQRMIADYEKELSVSLTGDQLDEAMARLYPNVVGNGHPSICMCRACAPGEYYDEYEDQAETSNQAPAILPDYQVEMLDQAPVTLPPLNVGTCSASPVDYTGEYSYIVCPF